MIDLDEVYDELEDSGIKYSAHEVNLAVKRINWKINEEDIPLCIAGLLRNKVQLANVQLITYDEGEFTEWLENEQSKFDGGYQVVDHAGTIRYFGWNYGSRRTQELFIQKKTIFTTKKPMTESKKHTKKSLKEGVSGCFYNGEVCVLAETCPEGFVPGMLKRQGSRKNLKESNNGN